MALSQFVTLGATWSCQICTRCFGSEQELHRHIAVYQLEEQRLVIRLLEIQAHLPLKESPQEANHRQSHKEHACQTCFEYFDSITALNDHIAEFREERKQVILALSQIHTHPVRQDYGRVCTGLSDSDCDHGNKANSSCCFGEILHTTRFDDHMPVSGIGVKRKRVKAWAQRTCPYSECYQKDKTFASLPQLRKHFQSHVSCLEICVYCRDVSTKVSTARRHECEDRERTERDDIAKRSGKRAMFKATRRDQLARQSEEEMNNMLYRISASQSQESSVGAAQSVSKLSGYAQRNENVPQRDTRAIETQDCYSDPKQIIPQYSSFDFVGDDISLANTVTNGATEPFSQAPPSLDTSQAETAVDLMEYAQIFDVTIAPLYLS